MNKDIEELRVRLNKTLENYELDKKFGKMSIDSIYPMFPSEIEKLLNYINELQQRIDKAIKEIENIKSKMIEQERYYIDSEIILEILRGNSNE